MPDALEVEDFSVRFGKTEVIHRPTSRGGGEASSLAIIGPNGSGKTALFRALVGASPHVRADGLSGLGVQADLRQCRSHVLARLRDPRFLR